MRRVLKFAALPPEDKALLVHATALLAGMRVALWVVPFQSLWRVVARFSEVAPAAKRGDRSIVPRIAAAVAAASRYVPDPTCLTRALTAKVLLARSGYACDLKIGVARIEGGFKAHAWIELDGVVVVGAMEGLNQYMPMPSLDGVGRTKQRTARASVPVAAFGCRVAPGGFVALLDKE